MSRTMVETAVVLLSGGMDSATALAMTIKEGHPVISLTFDYGQRHRKEIDAANGVAKHFRVADQRVASSDREAIGGSALTHRRIAAPRKRRLETVGQRVATTDCPSRSA